jgi:endonuclease/exonuclease/phosphatase family metal-dependent hydrolase
VSIRQLSPLHTTPGPQTRPPELPKSADDGDRYDPGGPENNKRKWLAGAALGITGLGMLGGAGVYAGAHLPVCQSTQQIVGWEQGPCVSQSVAQNAATAWRYTHAPFHVGDALDGWSSGQSQVINSDAASEQATTPGEVTVVSWNLHHGQSQDVTGARPQLDTMISTLQAQDADILLLQEVAPQHADDLAEALDMQGYYAASTPVQGNLILLRPDIEVTSNSVAVTTGQSPSNGLGTLTEWILDGKGAGEPRNIQVLDVTLPGGQEAVVWNTHNMTGEYPGEMHERGAQIAVGAIRKHLDPGEIVIGGGDLNARSTVHPLVRELEELPIQGHSVNIDWIYASDGLPVEFQHQRIREGDIMVSDHILVRATIDTPRS